MYRVNADGDVLKQISALSDAALLGFTGAKGILRLIPWYGPSIDKDSPDGAVRQYVFGSEGRGLMTYLILEEQQRVDVLLVQWAA